MAIAQNPFHAVVAYDFPVLIFQQGMKRCDNRDIGSEIAMIPNPDLASS